MSRYRAPHHPDDTVSIKTDDWLYWGKLVTEDSQSITIGNWKSEHLNSTLEDYHPPTGTLTLRKTDCREIRRLARPT